MSDFKVSSEEISLISSVFVRLSDLRYTGTMCHGELNNNYVLADSNDVFYVLRKPKKNRLSAIKQIHDEFNYTGFLSLGGNYRFRTINDQVRFMYSLNRVCIPSILPVCYESSWILLPFIKGSSYCNYLRQKNVEENLVVTTQVLTNLIQTHKKNIIYGDRWAGNTIVGLNGNTLEIDFDLEIYGDNAKEFELSEVIFNILLFSSHRKEMVNLIANYFLSQPYLHSEYRFPLIIRFLRGYTNYSQTLKFEVLSVKYQEEVHLYVEELINIAFREN